MAITDRLNKTTPPPASTHPLIRLLLALLGLLLLGVALSFVFYSLHHHVTTHVKTPNAPAGFKTEVDSTVDPGSPSDALIGTFATVGGVFVLASAFWNRTSKITAFGVEIDLNPEITKALQRASMPKPGLTRTLSPTCSPPPPLLFRNILSSMATAERQTQRTSMMPLMRP